MNFTHERWMRGVVASLMLAALSIAQARAESDAHPIGSVTEEVLVVGEHPGPGLWKISKGSHTLWLLGTYIPTPKGMIWRSKQVESVIAVSNEVLGPYSVSLRVQEEQPYLARKGTLKEALPRKVYKRWSALRDEYIGEGVETETLLPTAAALLLQSKAYERSGLSYSDNVWRTIYRIANANAVPVLRQAYDMNPIPSTRNRSRLPRQNGVKYLIETMDRLAIDISQARVRANAWAVGDLEALQSLVETDASYAKSLAYSWPFLSQDEVNWLQTDAENRLLSALERALSRNETTFAALPVYLISRPKGIVSQLRAAGFRVEVPQ
jgi:uncharacterized protein YbaP (TraB family)